MAQNDLCVSTIGRATRWWKFTITGLSGAQTAGKGLSGLLVMDYAAHRTGGSGKILEIKIVEKIATGSFAAGNIKAVIANKPFTASVGGTLTFPDADSDHLILCESIASTYTNIDITKQLARTKDINVNFDADTNDSSLYMALYANGSFTFPSGSELDVWVYVAQDEVA